MLAHVHGDRAVEQPHDQRRPAAPTGSAGSARSTTISARRRDRSTRSSPSSSSSPTSLARAGVGLVVQRAVQRGHVRRSGPSRSGRARSAASCRPAWRTRSANAAHRGRLRGAGQVGLAARRGPSPRSPWPASAGTPGRSGRARRSSRRRACCQADQVRTATVASAKSRPKPSVASTSWRPSEPRRASRRGERVRAICAAGVVAAVLADRLQGRRGSARRRRRVSSG